MAFDFSKIAYWLTRRISPKVELAVTLFTGLLLFVPLPTLGHFGVSALVQQYRPWIGIGFLASGCLLCGTVLISVWTRLKDKIGILLFKRASKRCLHRLAPDEMLVMQRYISKDVSTLKFPLGNGVADNLEAKGLLYRASRIGNVIDGFPYTIVPWVRDYLIEHPSLLLTPQERIALLKTNRGRHLA